MRMAVEALNKLHAVTEFMTKKHPEDSPTPQWFNEVVSYFGTAGCSREEGLVIAYLLGRLAEHNGWTKDEAPLDIDV